jgi:hypothetical protein
METKMAFQNSNVTKPAAGDAANTGMMKTPPPTRPAVDDDVTSIRHPSPPSYGRSHPGFNPSSLAPGKTLSSDLAKNLAASSSAEPDGSESLLDRIARLGVAKSGDQVDLQSPQTRKVDATQLPASFGLKNQSDSAKAVRIPSTMGSSPMADEMKRRADALTRAKGDGA